MIEAMPIKAKVFGAEQRKTSRPRENRPTSCQRGYDRRWQEYSRAFIAQHPRCAGVLIGNERVHAGSCRGLSECTDHVQAVTGADDPRFWDENNHQALSVACNSLKRVKVDGRGAKSSHVQR